LTKSDEVDVFFSKEFYGSSYSPITRVSHPAVSELIRHIWHCREKGDQSPLKLGAIKKTSVFTDCLQVIQDPRLLEEGITGMLSDLRSFEGMEHVVSDDGRIGHKMQDGISFKLSYFYKTMWLYFLRGEELPYQHAATRSRGAVAHQERAVQLRRNPERVRRCSWRDRHT